MKKLKRMCINVGIKGVGDPYGEIWLGILPREWHCGALVETVRYDQIVVMKDHNGALYTPSFDRPFSYTLAHEGSRQVLSLAHCLRMLGLYSTSALHNRLRELEIESDHRERAAISVKFTELCKQIGIKPTVQQMTQIGLNLRKSGK